MTINEILEDLGLDENSTYQEILDKLSLVTITEENNLKSISVKPLPNTIKDKALELKNRLVNLVIDDEKGTTSIINKRVALIKALIGSLDSMIEVANAKNTEQDTALNTLDGKINTEKSRNDIQDSRLSSIDSSISAINSKNTSQDATLVSYAQRLTTIENYINSLDSLYSALRTANQNHQYDSGRLSEVERTTTSLQSQIDDINALQNLVDILADLAELGSYDRTKLHTGDKIQVLEDYEHDNESTVYNWDGTDFTYIGKYGKDSYTKAESNELYAPKRINLLNTPRSTATNDNITLYGNDEGDNNASIKISISELSNRVITITKNRPLNLQVGQLWFNLDEEGND